jgi:hypothetical protein
MNSINIESILRKCLGAAASLSLLSFGRGLAFPDVWRPETYPKTLIFEGLGGGNPKMGLGKAI